MGFYDCSLAAQIVDVKTVDTNRLRWVGFVDSMWKDHIAVAAEWLALTDKVTVFESIVGLVRDVTNEPKLTVVVELLVL